MLRGVSLLCIFVDHIPGDALNWVTLRNFGFSDAAEIFVMLAGFASLMAYGRSFARDGAGTGLRKIVLRCARLWLFQVGLLIVTIGIVWFWNRHYGLVDDDVTPMLHAGTRGIVRGVTLRSQPSNLNILPLYILLLAAFPLIYAGFRFRVWLTVLASALLWIGSNLMPNINLINGLDGSFWFFDPFSWQFMFVLGALLATLMARSGGALPRLHWLTALCWVFLLVSFLEVFPWDAWGLPSLAPFDMEPPDKTHLAPLRLLHALALVYVVLSGPVSATGETSVRGWLGTARAFVLRGLTICGRHSLEVFSLGTVLALIGKLILSTFTTDWQMQVAINAVGMGGMLGLAWLLEVGRKRPAPAPAPAREPVPAASA